MKRIVIHVTLAVTMVLGIVGCTSDEEKMLKLVRADLVAEIPSLENYTPLESTIEVAKNDYIYDSVIMEKGIIMAVVKDAIDSIIDELHDLSQSSYYSDLRLQTMMTGLNMCYLWHREWSAALDTVRLLAKNIDTTEVVGWRVTQRFKYNDSDGNPITIKTIHIINKELNRIIYREEPDIELVQKCHLMIDDATLNEKPPIHLGYKHFVAISPMGLDSIGALNMTEEGTPESIKVFTDVTERFTGKL